MVTPSRTRDAPGRKKRQEASSGGFVAKLMTSADMAFVGVKLPTGVSVYVSADKAETLEQVRRESGGRFSATRAVLDEAVKAQVDLSAYEPDARARAILKGAAIARETLRAAGGAYNLEEVQALLNGVTRQAVEKKVNEGALLAVPGPSNRRSYPTVQFDDGGALVDGLKDVAAALPTRNPWSILHFLVTPDGRLGGRTPIDLLKSGQADLVVEAARRVGEQGA